MTEDDKIDNIASIEFDGDYYIIKIKKSLHTLKNIKRLIEIHNQIK